MKGGAHFSPFAALSFPSSKKVHIYCWVDRNFQSLDGDVQPRTHDLPTTFCTITKPLLITCIQIIVTIDLVEHISNVTFFNTYPLNVF